MSRSAWMSGIFLFFAAVSACGTAGPVDGDQTPVTGTESGSPAGPAGSGNENSGDNGGNDGNDASGSGSLGGNPNVPPPQNVYIPPAPQNLNVAWTVPTMPEPAVSGLSRNLDVPLTVKEVAGVGASEFPVSVVVPLPYGHYAETASLRVLNPQGQAVPAQFEVINRHWNKDNSIRHVMAHFLASVPAFGAPGSGTAVYRLTNSGPAPAVAASARARSENGSVILSTGAAEVRVQLNPFRVIMPSGDLRPVLGLQGGASQLSFNRSDITVNIEESGPVRAVVKAQAPTIYNGPGDHVHGWAMRIYAYAGKPYVKVDFQLQNSAITRRYSRPLFFDSFSLELGLGAPVPDASLRSQQNFSTSPLSMPLGALSAGSVTAFIRNFQQTWPNGLSVASGGPLTAELWPAWSSQFHNGSFTTAGVYWLDDMQQTVKEVLFHFGALTAPQAQELAQTFQFHPVVTLPVSWYADTRVTLDLGGHMPYRVRQASGDARMPDYARYSQFYSTAVPLQQKFGWLSYGLDVYRRTSTAMAGDWPYSASAFYLTENPADYYFGEDFAMAELNIRPVWLAGYRYEGDFDRIEPSENPYSTAGNADMGRNWRSFIVSCFPKLDAPGMDAALAAYRRDGWCSQRLTGQAYLPGTGWNAWARDDEHSWIYHVEEAYHYTGNPWIRDWYAFLGEFRKTRLNQRDPFPDMTARAVGHSVAQALHAYKILGDPEILPLIHDYFTNEFAFGADVHAQSGGRALYEGGGGPTTQEAPFQLGFLSRALVNYMEELGRDDRQIMALISGFVNWNLNYANYGYYNGPVQVNAASDGSAQTLVDAQLWLYLLTNDARMLNQSVQFIDSGIGGGGRPYANMRVWRGDHVGRLSDTVLP